MMWDEENKLNIIGSTECNEYFATWHIRRKTNPKSEPYLGYPIEMPSCCGAGHISSARLMGWSGLNIVRAFNKYAYLITDTEAPGSQKICDGIYLATTDQMWSPEMVYRVPTSAVKTSIGSRWIPGHNTPRVSPILGGKMHIFHGFCSVYLEGYFDHFKNGLDKTKDLIAICASGQHSTNEAMLLKNGFSIVKRCYSPKTHSPLTLYYRKKG